MPFYCGNDFLGEHSQFIDRRIHIIGSDRSTYFRGNCHVLAGLLYRDYCGSMMATQIGKPLKSKGAIYPATIPAMLYAIGRNINKYHRFLHDKTHKFEGKTGEKAA